MKKVVLCIVICLGILNVFAQKDVANSKDYYLLDRMPDYYISNYSDVEFDSHSFFIDGNNVIKEGRKLVIKYRHSNESDKDFKFSTRLQLLRNYSNAIKKTGGIIIFERYNSEHGYYTFKNNGKSIWIQVKTASNGKYYTLYIIEEEDMRQDIVIDAELIKNKIDVEGKIAIYGIYFDTGKTIIKEESKLALEQIAKFLKENPAINCWVVGHTDADGSFKLNSELSLNRARAIKKALETSYNISSKRLFAEGVGPLSPVATNTTEEGKALNRRVELVKK